MKKRPIPVYGRGDIMVIAAMRYCLGRSTYIVSDCCEWLIAHWNTFEQGTRDTIQRDIERAFRQDNDDRTHNSTIKALGHDSDREEWERVRNLWSIT